MQYKAAPWLRAVAGALFASIAVSAAAMSAPAQELAQWAQRSGDARHMPFAIVDKQSAELHVFNAEGRLVGSTPALLGARVGDDIVPGVGERAQRRTLRPEDRTTPAGRFEAFGGRNYSGEAVVWVDYESAFAIHRLRPGRALKSRTERLAHRDALKMRVSDGCVVVPTEFYEHVVQRVLGAGRSVVYVMPEREQLGKSFF